ncbi:PEP-CTERM sorting domain-containing protein [Alteromonas sp. BL110]|uniref:PEP-CTERM sorting domain-containing protein n=1 Tax=Alteromonas sp. BL110 TaxID=1714845 RepID=UPI000E4E93F6|nr:PEP-CTERM sorting domain-containing protein [Alteromonas sp. BL110]AXT39974.1 PEP-CTERM sorting domain-containing protein [Alteromonas sp. BL110]RKM79204.1 PEP-CTERM sorting domain-containing protein [Alteromonas sp. BL110]
MKKFFLLLLAAATFNANAALISITTNKDVYNVGETIIATVSATELIDDNAVQTYFNGYNALFDFDSLLLSLNISSIVDLGALGAQPMVGTFGSDGNTLSIDAIEFIFASSTPFFPGAVFAQEGKDVVELFSFSLLALNAGIIDLTPTSVVLAQGGNPQSNTIEGTSFEIAQVPAPGTFALSLLALAGMLFARKRAK